MLVREVMTAPVVTVPRTATARQAIRVMVENDVSALPVVDPDGAMLGLVTEADLLRGEFEADPRAFARPAAEDPCPPPVTVDQVMTREVLTAGETTDVASVAELLVRKGIKNLPVLRGGRLVGILNRRDLLCVLAHTDARIRDDVLAAVRELLPDAGVRAVRVRDGQVTIEGPADAVNTQVISLIARTVPGVSRVGVVDRATDRHPA